VKLYGKFVTLFLSLLLVASAGCSGSDNVITNPWLVPFQKRHGSALSRSQMRAMVRLARVYQEAGMNREYLHAMTTGVELYAGDIGVTFELLNILIDKINAGRSELSGHRTELSRLGIDPDDIDPLPDGLTGDQESAVERYLESRSSLEGLYEETYRILSSACGQIPYNPELYYRTAHLQFLRAEEDGDRDKYKDAINFLKRAIASDSSHLESYHLIATSYERMGDRDRALRFWRLFEVIYEIAPQTMGPSFVTPQREVMHEEALRHIEELEGVTGQ
jgi:tetratricopeptide (TPR) repeat protein